jgi:proton-dependent oligopeptide transporter, POT family
MESHGVPNDLLSNVNSITVLLTLPLATHLLYPFLRRHKIALPPITRITIGFVLEAGAMALATIVQQLIYTAGPCYRHPLSCPASDNGRIPNAVNMMIQIPIFFLEGLGEVFSNPAGYEYAFTKAPVSMKSIVQAVFGLTAAVGSIIGLALSPKYKDPDILVVYAVLAGGMGITAVIMWAVFGKYNDREKELNKLNNRAEREKENEISV